jgi:hypothetical protein
MAENTHTTVAGVFPQIPNPTSGSDYQATTGLSIETSNGLRFYGNGGGYYSDMGNASLLIQAIYNDNMSGTQGLPLNGANTSNNVATYTAGTSAGYALGCRWLGAVAGPYLNGYIYEVLSSTIPSLPQTSRQQVEGYLAWKWNLQSQLSPTHPYKNESAV